MRKAGAARCDPPVCALRSADASPTPAQEQLSIGEQKKYYILAEYATIESNTEKQHSIVAQKTYYTCL